MYGSVNKRIIEDTFDGIDTTENDKIWYQEDKKTSAWMEFLETENFEST